MTTLSRRALLAAAGAASLPVHASVLKSPPTLIADRAVLPRDWAGTALVLETGSYIDEAWLARLPVGPAIAALMPANAFLLAELLRVRRRPLMVRAGRQHFSLD
jgi:hypothetical protein